MLWGGGGGGGGGRVKELDVEGGRVYTLKPVIEFHY